MKKIGFILLFFLLAFGARSQFFDDYELNYIKVSVDTLIKQLDRYDDFTVDGVSLSDEYLDKFLDFFVDPTFTQIYNDLTKKPKFITPMDYIGLVRQHFLSGLATKYVLDSAKYYLPKKVNDTTFYLWVKIPKYLVGLYEGRQIVYHNYIAHIKITFVYYNYEMKNFKIDQILDNETVMTRLSNKRMRGVYVSFNGAAMNTQFYFSEATSGYIRTDQITLGFLGGASLTYFINSHLGFSVGANFLKENAVSSVIFDNYGQNNLPKVDQDSDLYYLYVKTNLSEKISNDVLYVPVELVYKTGYYNKVGFFLTAGIVPKIVLNSNIYVSGKSERAGYYPEYHLLITDVEDYGFGTFTYNNDKYSMQLNQIIFAAYGSTGISVPLNKGKSYINLTLFYSRTLTDIGYKTSVYKDDFISYNQVPKNTFFHNYGVFIRYMFKL